MVGPTLEHEAKKIYEQGFKIGFKEGFEEGFKQVAEEKMKPFLTLISKLLAANRLEDLERACEDKKYRKQIYEELGIKLSE